MPIEIRELVIKVTVREKEKQADPSKALKELKNRMVKECIDKVMARLETLPQR